MEKRDFQGMALKELEGRMTSLLMASTWEAPVAGSWEQRARECDRHPGEGCSKKEQEVFMRARRLHLGRTQGGKVLGGSKQEEVVLGFERWQEVRPGAPVPQEERQGAPRRKQEQFYYRPMNSRFEVSINYSTAPVILEARRMHKQVQVLWVNIQEKAYNKRHNDSSHNTWNCNKECQRKNDHKNHSKPNHTIWRLKLWSLEYLKIWISFSQWLQENCETNVTSVENNSTLQHTPDV